MRVLLAGGTGSFGRAFAEAILTDEPRLERLIVVSRDEVKQAEMREALGPDPRLRFLLGDVRDRERLALAMHGCDVVVNAAALKRVDSCAYSPTEALDTNVGGTRHVLEAALSAGVGRVLVLSSDKSVEVAGNLYGATKAMAEALSVAWNAVSYPRGLRVACLRYGNVLGSRGSVVHTFRQAIAAGRPLQVTDSGATRFWLEMGEAVALARWALDAMRGGEVFVPGLSSATMGDFAAAVIAESGKGDWPVESVGFRPGGEKRHEVLLSRHESARTVEIKEVMPWPLWAVEPDFRTWTTGRPAWAGPPAPESWESDRAPHLSQERLRQMLSRVP